MDPQQFNDREMRDILSRALRLKSSGADKVSYAEMEEVAKELGIDPSTLKAAITEYTAGAATAAEEAATRSKKRNGVVMHGIVFVFVNVAFLFSNAYQGTDIPMHWVLLGWGIGLIAHILKDWFGWEFEDE